jgi:signal transduction histidine kinase
MKLTAAPASAEDQGAAGPPDQTAVQLRPVRRITAALWAATLLAALAVLALTLITWGDLKLSDGISSLYIPVAAVAYATLGVLIIRRAANLIGWIMLAEGIGLAFVGLTSGYAIAGVAAHPGSLPAAKLAGTLSECIFSPVTFLIAFMFLLFPTGKLPSPRWRPVAAAGLLLVGLTLTGLAVTPRLLQLPAPGGISLIYPNPLGVENLKPVLRAVPVGTLNGLAVVFVAFMAAVLVSLAVRYRAGGRLMRQQIKWLALAAAVFAVLLFIALLGVAAGEVWLNGAANAITAVVALFGIPAAMTIAILKYRLFDIDVIISRAVVYGLLSAALTGVYVGIVLGIGTFVGHRGGTVLTIAAAATIALLFQPLRRRAQLFANRLVYGKRATPYQALSDFTGDMAGQLDLTEAVDRMVSVLAGATGADRAEAWIRVGTELRPAAIWPHGSPPSTVIALDADGGLPPFDGASHAVDVKHGGELLGALSLQKPRNEPLTSTEDELLRHLASQAGLVLRNAALTAELQATIDELRASRRRLVEAQDAERQRIERNLHDGAQQHLVALNIQLGLLDDAADDPGEVKEIAGQLRAGLHAALDDLRALARGIYPPLLADQGLAAAVAAQARRAPLPVLVEADGIGRYRRDAEATAYFCILEALQNVAKYARASQATVALSCPDGHLEFAVTDDGAGFDTTTPTHGTGLQGMADRLAAVGGTFRIDSTSGQGTTISGALPVPELAQASR